MTSADPELPNADVPPTAPGETNSPESDLPEDFLITPEYVEEEAIRGDFVIRWAAILLAVLMGCTHLVDTTLLVRIRSGEFLAANGILPQRTDVLSYTAIDRPWANLSWLGDLLLAGLYGIGGGIVLSLFGAVLAGLAFWLLSRCGRTGVSTWWGSICAALATIAAFPLLTPGPGLMTVLGLSLVLLIVQFWRERPTSPVLWSLVPVMLFWSNLDPRAFLGGMFLLLYAIGLTVGHRATIAPGKLWGPVAAALVAMFVHPFPLDVLMSPVQLVTVEYPLLREYPGTNPAAIPSLWRPVFDRASWSPPTWHTLAAVLLGLAAVVTQVMNRRRLDGGLLLAFLGLNLFALTSGIDFAAVAILNAVVATLNAQTWYLHNWRQEYSIEPRELLLGRAGRAITVLGLFFSAYWFVSGHMTGAAGRRVGLGFSHWLTAQVDGYQELLGEVPDDELDDHPFHITPQQGDLLVWLGRRSFTDNRLSLFAKGEVNLLETQRELAQLLNSTGRTLETPAQISEWAVDWNRRLDNFSLTHVVVPLDTAAGYRLWVNMASQAAVLSDRVIRYWQLVDVGGPAAVLYRLEANPELVAGITGFLRKKTLGSVEGVIGEVFRPETVGQPVLRGVFPRSPTFYETRLLLPEPIVSNDILVARHYATRLGAANRSIAETLAYCHKIIRHARRGLASDQNAWEGYLLLGDTFGQLWQTELSLTGGNPYGVAVAERRFFEAIFALHHASIRNPTTPDPHAALFPLYFQHGDYDLALKHLDRLHELTGYYTALHKDQPGFGERHQEGKRLRDQLKTALEQSQQLIDQADGTGDIGNVVGTALQVGCPGQALAAMERDLTVVVSNPALTDRYAALLLLVGRTEEGFDQALRLHSQLDTADKPFVLPTLARAYMASDDQDRVADLWKELGQDRCDQLLESHLGSLPLLLHPRPQLDAWPVLQWMSGMEGLMRWEPEWEQSEWQIAMSHLEQGRNVDAVQVLQSLLTLAPETPLRPLTATYLTLLTGQEVPFSVSQPAAPASNSDAPPAATSPSATPPESPAPPASTAPTNPAPPTTAPQ